MKSAPPGRSTSRVEVENISKHGLWLFVRGREYYLSFQDYPWFKRARVSEMYDVEFLHGTHLHWPTLDIDLELESLQHPGNYPLTYKS